MSLGPAKELLTCRRRGERRPYPHPHQAKERLEQHALRDQAGDRRPGARCSSASSSACSRRTRADRGRARPRQDADGQDDRRRARRHVRPHPVHARPRPFRPRRHAHLPRRRRRFDTELGPVFCNFLLADEINRAPAKVQSALLEVMQEHQVTIGRETHPRPRAFPRPGDTEPDRVRGHVPAARRRRSTGSC